jgi:hypothetical protein
MLVQANAEDPDVLALPALVGALGTGRMAIEAVAKFGNRAAEPVLTVFEDWNANPMNRIAASRCLAAIAAANQLNLEQLKRLDQMLIVTLNRPERFVVAAAAIDLAAQVGAPGARKVLERIANAGDAQLVEGDALDHINLQERAKRALSQR